MKLISNKVTIQLFTWIGHINNGVNTMYDKKKNKIITNIQ